VGAAVVALALLAALVIGEFEGVRLGEPPSSPGVAPSGASPTTYYGSLPAANAAARALYWDWPANDEPPLVFAEGLAAPSALGSLVNSTHLGTADCSPTLLSTSIPALPAYSGPATAGLAQGWLFAFSTTAGALLVLAVVNGTASIVATTTSVGPCYDGPGSFSTVVVDSSVAATVAGATGTSKSFFEGASASHSPVSGQLLLVPPGYVAHTPLDPMWLLNYSTCTLYGGTTGPGTTLASIVNAATGALYSQSSVDVAC
jgi:hypothetical protein